KSKGKAKIVSRLVNRNWNAFTEFKRSHLFVEGVEAGASPAAAGTAATTPRDLTPGDHDVPPFSLGGQDMYAVSPDGQEVAYTSNIDEVEATSTNNEIFIVPIAVESAVPSGKSPNALRTAHATAQPKKISTSPGADTTPLYSPDGKYLAWRSQARAGFEADKWRLSVQNRQSGKTEDVTANIDSSVESFDWSSDSSQIVFTAEEQGSHRLFWVTSTAQPGLRRIKGSNTWSADDLVCRNGRVWFSK